MTIREELNRISDTLKHTLKLPEGCRIKNPCSTLLELTTSSGIKISCWADEPETTLHASKERGGLWLETRMNEDEKNAVISILAMYSAIREENRRRYA